MAYASSNSDMLRRYAYSQSHAKSNGELISKQAIAREDDAVVISEHFSEHVRADAHSNAEAGAQEEMNPQQQQVNMHSRSLNSQYSHTMQLNTRWHRIEIDTLR